MRLGGYDVTFLDDGTLYSPDTIVTNLEAAEVRRTAPPDAEGKYPIPVNVFLLRRGPEMVLIDAGAGNTMQPTMGRLGASLAAAGVSPGEVTHVIMTHIHPDHANGLVDDHGAAVYPNATVVVHATEHDFWMGPPASAEPENVARNRRRARVNLDPYADRLQRVRDGDAVAGLTAMLAPGHTPGHTLWLGGEGGERFAAWGDLVHLAAVQVPQPDAAVIYDLDGARAAATRRQAFDMLAGDGVLILGAHLGRPGAARLLRHGGSYVLEPI